MLHRVSVAHVGLSAPRELLRDKYSRTQVNSFRWVSKTWWTAPDHTVLLAAVVPGWPMPMTTWSTTGCSRHPATLTPQWWGCWLCLHQNSWNSPIIFPQAGVKVKFVYLPTGYPAMLLRQQTCSCSYQRLQVHTQRRWAGSGWCRGNYWSNHCRHWCKSCKLHVLQFRLVAF